jgi:hypothetical protein
VILRIRSVLSLTIVFALVMVVGGLEVWHRHSDKLPRQPGASTCVIEAGGEVSLEPDQTANAATITAVGLRRGMPERAILVALATSLQESQLHNLAGGDRDSIGLFQQRPSQGWGSPSEIRDPRYAAGKFYDALKRVRGWQTMRVTEAAQAVQRSAHPELYEQWVPDATVLTKALIGAASKAVACTVTEEPATRGEAAALALHAGLQKDWGNLSEIDAAASISGVAITAADPQSGWRYAHWLVAHAADQGVKKVRYGGQEWTAKGGVWTTVTSADPGVVVGDVYS